MHTDRQMKVVENFNQLPNRASKINSFSRNVMNSENKFVVRFLNNWQMVRSNSDLMNMYCDWQSLHAEYADNRLKLAN